MRRRRGLLLMRPASSAMSSFGFARMMSRTDTNNDSISSCNGTDRERGELSQRVGSEAKCRELSQKLMCRELSQKLKCREPSQELKCRELNQKLMCRELSQELKCRKLSQKLKCRELSRKLIQNKLSEGAEAL